MISNEEFELASQRGKERSNGPTVIAARYDRRISRIVVSLSTGYDIMFPLRDAEGIETAKPAELSEIEISPSGLGIHFPKLDADLYLPALLDGVMGSKKWSAARLGAAGGSVKSEAKTTAARVNGSRGGRPRKKIAEPI